MHLVYDTTTATWCKIIMQTISPTNIGLVADTTMAIDRDLYFRINGKDKTLAFNIREIGMRTVPIALEAAAGTAPVVRPVWAASNCLKAGFSCDLRFKPEETQDMWLLFHLNDGRASLVSSRKDVTCGRDIFMPGLPNTFAYGTLCTGEARLPPPQHIATLGMTAWVNAWVEAWGEAPFNGDLLQDFQRNRTLRFNTETLENVKLGDTWASAYNLLDISTPEAERVRDTLIAITALRGGANA